MAKLESVFQGELRRKLKTVFPGCLILKNDPAYLTGIPDLTILYLDRWAFLEVKRSANDGFQPNQQYYIDWANENSFGATIYPENESAILMRLQQFFAS